MDLLAIMGIVGPILLGWGFSWIAGKCRGRNARRAFQFAAWGTWLLLLRFLPIGLFWPLNLILLLIPSAICYLQAANSLMKEMRSQKTGEYSDPA